MIFAKELKQRMHGACALSLAFCLLIIETASAFEMGEEFHTVSTAVQTPHIPWAKPLASGSLRLLVIAPRFAHRETAELMERLDAQCDVVMTHSYKQIGVDSPIAGMRESDILQSLRTQLKRPHDVIIVGNFSWALIPKPIQYEILRQVTDGAGLLYVPFTESTPKLFERLFRREPIPEALLRSVPWGSFPSLQSAPEGGSGSLWIASRTTDKQRASVLRFCGALRRGRCLVLRWRAGAGGFHCLTPEPKEQIEYEYDMALVARTILWLARRQAEAEISFRPESDAPQTVLVEIAGHTLPQTLDVIIRDQHNEVELRAAPKVADKRAVLNLPPTLKGGRHFLDAWIRADRNGPIVTWASAYFDIERDGKMEAIKTERDYYLPGDTVRAVVEFAKPLTKAAELALSAFDIHGREWGRVSAPVQAGKKSAALEFRADAMLSTYSRLRVELTRNGILLQRAFGDLYTPLRTRPDFALGVWGGGGDSWLSHSRWRLNYERGLTAAVFDGDIKAGVRPNPYSTTKFRHGGKGEVRKPCLTDPNFWRDETEHLQRIAKSLTRADVFAYSLGDEICLDVGNTNVCRSATCLAGLRKWLKEQYGTLEALNSEWGTAFAHWDAVTPTSSSEAKKGGNLAPWLDHRIFMDRVFADGLNRAQDIIHEVDPLTPVGAEGLWGSASAYGMDWRLMTRKLDFLVPYWDKPLMRECIRSFKRADCTTGTWFGNYGEQSVDEEYLRWLPWNVLVHQYNSVWWYPEYRAVQFGAAACGLAPDYRPTKGLAAALDEISAIRSGIATLLLRLKRENDGIAVLYSRKSTHINRSDVGELLIALEAIGLQYDMIAAERLSAERLMSGRCKLLILPDVCVLSDQEAAAIVELVREGGCALAVLPAGVYDAHGKRRQDSALRPIFGVRGLNAEVHNQLRRVQPAGGGDAFDVAQISEGLELSGATALASFDDGAPAAAYQKFGAGQAVLLAFSFNGFNDARTLWRTEIPLRSFLRGVIKRLGVASAIEVVSAKPVRGLEVARFTDGQNDYVAMTLQPLGPLRSRSHEPQRFELRMRDRKLTYDVRAGKGLDLTDAVEMTMRPGDCRVLARLSAEPPEPSIDVAPDRINPGTSLVVSIRADGGLSRCLRLRVIRPDGVKAKWWTQNCFVQNGSAKVTLHIAHNAPLGDYVAAIRDVVTGQRASALFRVKE